MSGPFGEPEQASGKAADGRWREVSARRPHFRARQTCDATVFSRFRLHSDAVLQKWGRVAANFTRDQWICLSFLTKEFGSGESANASPDTLKAALSCSTEALTLLPGDLVLPVLAFLETLLPRVSQRTY